MLLQAVYFELKEMYQAVCFLFLPIEQGNRFIQQLICERTDFSFEKSTISEMAISALQELGNILAGLIYLHYLILQD